MRVRVLMVAVATGAMMGCTASEPPLTDGSRSASSPAPGQPDAGVQLLGAPGAELAPGRYTREGFAPAVTFSVGPGWTAEQVAAGFFDIQQDVGSPDVTAVQFGVVTGHDTAAEARAALATAEHILATAQEPVTLGGLPAVVVLAETDDPPDAAPPIFRDVLTVSAGPVSIASARRLLVYFVDTADGVLAVMVGGSIAEWERTLALAQPVLDSLTVR